MRETCSPENRVFVARKQRNRVPGWTLSNAGWSEAKALCRSLRDDGQPTLISFGEPAKDSEGELDYHAG